MTLPKSRTTILLASVFLLFTFTSAASGARKKARAEVAFESGKQYAQSGLYDQAIRKFDEAISYDPEHAQAYMNQGVCYIQKGKDYYPVARGKLQQASRLRTGAKDPLVWYNLTVIYTLTGEFVRAFEALDRTLSHGFKEYDALRSDEDLYELRRKDEFRKILEKHNVFL